MRNLFAKLLPVFVLWGLITPAYSLTIVPTFDGSITNDPHAAQMEAAINGAINVLESHIQDDVTVNVLFVSDESVGLGESQTLGSDYAYSDFLNALNNQAVSVNDFNALSKLPSSSTDPVIGGTQIHLTTPQARVLGLDDYSGMDSTVKCKMSLMNFTRPPADPDKYDLQQVVEHELDEVLGISSGLPATDEVWPADLFRYTTNLVRTFITSGDDAYFSADGTNLIARYNMDASGDYGDWWSVNYPTNWSPVLGDTLSNPQVQDAFSGPGNALDLGVSELTILDVVGWTLVVPPPTLKIVSNGANQFTLSWPDTYSGFVLQERTNLVSGHWAFTDGGNDEPVTLTSTDTMKFYRLYQPIVSTQSPAHKTHVAPVPHSALQITTRIYCPRQH